MKKALYFLPTALYYALIFFLSSRSYQIEVHTPFFDKAVHILEFAVLGLLLSFGFFKSLQSSLKAKSLLAFCCGLLLGLLDEAHQSFVPLRQFEILDLVADGTGILIGLLAYLILARKLNHKRNLTRFSFK